MMRRRAFFSRSSSRSWSAWSRSTTGILGWIKDSSLPATERTAGAILRGGAACAATILLVLAVFTTAGALRWTSRYIRRADLTVGAWCRR